jgi:hypothetical protein
VASRRWCLRPDCLPCKRVDAVEVRVLAMMTRWALERTVRSASLSGAAANVSSIGAARHSTASVVNVMRERWR